MCRFNSFFSESKVFAFTTSRRKICRFSISPQSVIPNPDAPVSFSSLQNCVISSPVSVPVMANNAMGNGDCWREMKIFSKSFANAIRKDRVPFLGMQWISSMPAIKRRTFEIRACTMAPQPFPGFSNYGEANITTLCLPFLRPPKNEISFLFSTARSSSRWKAVIFLERKSRIVCSAPSAMSGMIISVTFMSSVAEPCMTRYLPGPVGCTSIRLPPNAKCMIAATW